MPFKGEIYNCIYILFRLVNTLCKRTEHQMLAVYVSFGHYFILELVWSHGLDDH